MTGNVLITSCAAKVQLVRAFRAAAASRGGKVFAADTSDFAAALSESDGRITLPAWSDPGYAVALLAACREHGIGLLVPSADRELLPMAQVAETLRRQGVTVLLPSTESLALCRDKRVFVDFCRQRGFPVPETWDAAEPDRFPVFVRPRQGQGGVGAGRVTTSALLRALREAEPDLLVQECVEDPEYSVDLLMDLDGRALQAVARRRLVVHGGEAQVSRVEPVLALTEAAMRLGESLRLVGHNVVQAFHSPARGVRFIEVNARFGGASSLAIAAGLDSPARLLALAAGDDAARQPRPIRYGLTLLRHGEDRFVMTDAA